MFSGVTNCSLPKYETYGIPSTLTEESKIPLT